MAARRLRRSPWLAVAGVAQAVGVALLPKCPLCLALDFGVLGSVLGAVQTRFGSLLWPSLAVAAGSAAVLAVRWRNRSSHRPPALRLRPCCQPGSATLTAR